MIEAKRSAYHLLAIVPVLYPETSEICLHIEKTRSIVLSKSNILNELFSDLSIEWNYILFRLSNQTKNVEGVIEICSRLGDVNEAEKIEAMSSLCEYTGCVNFYKIKLECVLIYLSECLQCYSNRNHSIRYYLIEAMLNLIRAETINIISKKLLQAKDFDVIITKYVN